MVEGEAESDIGKWITQKNSVLILPVWKTSAVTKMLNADLKT